LPEPGWASNYRSAPLFQIDHAHLAQRVLHHSRAALLGFAQSRAWRIVASIRPISVLQSKQPLEQ
jgi:hypothetical protein